MGTAEQIRERMGRRVRCLRCKSVFFRKYLIDDVLCPVKGCNGQDFDVVVG
ncbi:MAG: hypothetical protein ACE5IJ_11320 [Thermoplasmata archaeon]